MVESKGYILIPGMRSENAGRHTPRDLMNSEAGQFAPPLLTQTDQPSR
jgi:hypothetical protein